MRKSHMHSFVCTFSLSGIALSPADKSLYTKRHNKVEEAKASLPEFFHVRRRAHDEDATTPPVLSDHCVRLAHLPQDGRLQLGRHAFLLGLSGTASASTRQHFNGGSSARCKQSPRCALTPRTPCLSLRARSAAFVVRNAQEHRHALLSPPYPCTCRCALEGSPTFPPSMASFLPRFYAIMAHFYAVWVILRVLRGSRRSVRSFGTFRWSMAGWWCRIRVAAAADGSLPSR
jgi:hypothetical protein